MKNVIKSCLQLCTKTFACLSFNAQGAQERKRKKKKRLSEAQSEEVESLHQSLLDVLSEGGKSAKSGLAESDDDYSHLYNDDEDCETRKIGEKLAEKLARQKQQLKMDPTQLPRISKFVWYLPCASKCDFMVQ